MRGHFLEEGLDRFEDHQLLELLPYHTQPLPGTHVHGRKGTALVHVGAVDAPVTISQTGKALAETEALGQQELHVLGWEWEMGIHDPLVRQARQTRGVRLRLLNIPREVMERQGVDRDFQHDTFMNQWQAYRTRKVRRLDLESAEHSYPRPGSYQVLVKVVDIFGNDTSRLLTWEAV